MEPDDLSICDIACSLKFASQTPKRKVRSRKAKVGLRPGAQRFKAELSPERHSSGERCGTGSLLGTT
jgi:hypothetical protein